MSKHLDICMKNLVLGLNLILSTALNLPVVVLGLTNGLFLLLIGKILQDQATATLGWHILIAYDQAMNAATGGDPDETISSRTGKLRNSRPWAMALDWFLNKFESNHSKKAIEPDEGKDRIVE